MKKVKLTAILAFLVSGAFWGAGTVSAQRSPTPDFQGHIGKTLSETKVSRPRTAPQAPVDAPNVVWVVIDDIGYGAPSTFGGLIETPNIDRLADQGLRYTNFHTPAFCAPTRAALLTGRNPHSVHFGFFAHNSFDTPGYDGYLPFEKATVAEILRENGYNTFALGKYHLTHPSDATQAGPFNRWPTGRGFDHYYGFPPESWGADQWNPILYRDTQRALEDTKGRHVTELLADEAIRFISDQKAAAPAKPFFLYFAPGAVHAPIQVAKEWIDKYKGKFDKGWDHYREVVLERQKALGVVPANVTLPPRNPGVKPWQELSSDEKKLFTRHIEAYAGFVSHTDHEIGRIIDFVEKIGQLDNTLVVVVIGDNGAEGGGREIGRFLPRNPGDSNEKIVAAEAGNLERLGEPNSSVLYPDGWAAATNTPFRFYKSYANFEGGARNGLVLFYPKKIKDKGGIRNQYAYVADLLPTTLDLTGSKVPPVINGYAQEPVEGTSLAYSIDSENKNLPERHNVQYYEMTGSYAIYKDGWKASYPHDTRTRRIPESEERWYLYNLKEDFNEQHDLAAQYPEKVRELAELFDSEAGKYNVYPLKDRWEVTNSGIFDGVKRVTLRPGNSFTNFAGPKFVTDSYSIVAKAEIDGKGNEGVLLSAGGALGGISFYVKDKKLVFAYNADGKLTEVRSQADLPAGKAELKAEVTYTNEKKNKAVSLYVNGRKVGSSDLGTISAAGPTTVDGLEIGRDSGLPVGTYNAPFAFNGVLHEVVIEHR